MIYNLINKTPRIDETLLERVLKNRKINSLETYLNTPKEHEIHYANLINVDKVVEVLTERCIWAKNPEKILLLVDCDVDGYTSSAIFYRYMKRVRPDIDIIIVHHTGKQHGLSPDVLDTIINSDATIIVTPDASSSDYEQHKILQESGKTVIVLDHHESEMVSKDAIVVNNELSPAYKGSISGAGVVYKVCQALDDYIGFDEDECVAPELLDLVALGNIGDSINLHNLDTRYLIQQGLSAVHNQLILSICKKQEYSMGGVINITTVGWYVAPLLNAVVRAGTQEDKEKMFEGFLSDDEAFCDEVASMCASIKRKQDNNVKKILVSIQGMIEEKGLAENTNVLFVDATGMIENEIVGLVANKLLGVYKKPIILLHEKEKFPDVLVGSCRAPRGIGNFKSICTKTGEFNFCEGHGSAFGVSINKGNIEKAKALLNEALEGVENVDTGSYDVDAILMVGELRDNDITRIGSLSNLWGGGIDEPLFVVKNIKLNSSQIELIGSRKNTIKFTSRNGFEFVKFYAGQSQHMAMTLTTEDDFGDNDLILEVVCKFKVNEWNGTKKPQIEIVDFNVKKDEMAFF